MKKFDLQNKYFVNFFKIQIFAICILYFFYALLGFGLFLPKNIAEAETIVLTKQYARITRSNIPIYRDEIISNDSILFYPEMSYFVELLQPENNGFYKVKYMDITGYMLADDLVFVSGTPQNPFPENRAVKILANSGLNLRSTPTANDPFNILSTLPFLENNIKFIGKTYGDEYAPSMGDVWYYCCYLQENIYGYLYSVYCYPLSEVAVNTETLEVVDKPYFVELEPTTTTQTDALAGLSKPTQIVVITLVCLPCIFIVYMLFRPTKLSVDVGKNKKRKIKRLKKSDYYEFDD